MKNLVLIPILTKVQKSQILKADFNPFFSKQNQRISNHLISTSNQLFKGCGDTLKKNSYSLKSYPQNNQFRIFLKGASEIEMKIISPSKKFLTSPPKQKVHMDGIL